MFLTGPGVVREVMGEDVAAAELGGPRSTTATASATSSCADDAAAAALSRDAAVLPAAAQRARACRARSRSSRELADPGAVVPADPRKVYDVRDAIGGDRRRRLAAGDRSRAGRATIVTALRAHRRAPGRRRSPTSRATSAACSTPSPRRRARGSSRPATPSGCRWSVLVDTPGLHARHAAGAGRRDPPRRDARARVRGGDGAARDGRAAQGLRRRVHHDELEGPRRRHGARVAGGRAGRHGRAAGGRDHPPPRAGAPPTIPSAERDALADRLRRGAPGRRRRGRGGLRRRGDRAARRRAGAWPGPSRRWTTGAPARSSRERRRDRPGRQARPRHGRHHEGLDRVRDAPSSCSARAPRSC